MQFAPSTSIKRCLGLLLAAVLPAFHAPASTTAEVGASAEVSALPVLADTASECTTLQPDTLQPAPTTTVEATHADTAAIAQAVDSITLAAGPISPAGIVPKQFTPDPKRALWLSLVLPGAGQIYNRKFWKLPIFYGGFIGCAYALTWNQMMYRDYSQAYLDIMDDDPNTKSYLDMLPPRYDITGREDQFKQIFKRKKDFYRRYRDLSAFCFIGVYLLSVVDAYVDAQLSVFDISPDLSMSFEPAVIGSASPTLGPSPRRTAYGIGCALHF